MSHLDVVPVEAQARAEWTHPPFAGAIEDGYVWGRGSLDVKTGVIFWLEAVETLLSQGFEPRRTIYLAFGHDEEIAGPRGGAVEARLFAERGVHFAFVFDEGGLIVDGHPLLPDQTVAMVMTAEKAYYTVKLTAHGVSGHSSTPPPSTAIGQLARAIVAVEDNPMPTRLIAPLREMFTVLAPHLPLGERLVFDNLWLTSGIVEHEMLENRLSAPLVRTTFAATMIEGGVKENVIPEFAQATINVRILPGDTPEDVLAHLEKVIDDPGIEIEGTSWGVAGKPASIDGPAFQLASEAIHDVLPDAVVVPGLVAGATDSRYFSPVADEVLRFVPERIGIEQASGAHGRDERIAVETLGDSVEIAIGMMRRAGDPAPGP
jgi:carboxypeptidase PM20D1